MRASDIVFTLFMLCTPAVIMLFYRPRPGSMADLPEIRRRRRLLWIATGGAVLLYGGSLALDGFQNKFMWMMFFPLWFGLAMPLLLALRPEAKSPFAQTGPRVAALSSRRQDSPIGRWNWIALWLLWLGAVVAVVARGLLAGDMQVPWSASVVCLVSAAGPLALAPVWGPMLNREPEPLDRAGSAILVNAYAALRRARAWGLFWLSAGMCVLFSALAVTHAWKPLPSSMLGVVGAIGGSLIGISGAGFGAVMSHRRMRVRRLLDEAIAQES